MCLPPATSKTPPSYNAMLAAKNAKDLLLSGFTGSHRAAAARDIDFALKAAIEDGTVQGPRYLAC